ncbi:hypothetical protein D5S18_17855 [Nocardia panacis]|uniref:Uncharacterized protein n=1 Tax=Nocardia panacis TaxID=2340916 RepID=A0A3A4KGU4_9NOCA|nr:hypothetical protein [Nocardia panacis]RJO75218.1 hypothetical protein D5S18_17855 [Nocardia panacis]
MSPQEKLAVDPNVYYITAKKLRELADQIRGAVTGVLAPGLSATGGMAGSGSTVEGWAAEYNRFGADVRAATIAYAAALQHFADVVDAAGYNWDAAEYNGTSPERRTGLPPVRPAPAAVAALSNGDFPDVPNASFDNGPGVTVSPGSVATIVPNGRSGLLDTAAKAWDSFVKSEAVRMAPVTLQGLGSAFDAVRAPEVPDIVEGLGALQNGIGDIFSAADALGAAVRAYHDNLGPMRKGIVDAAPRAFPKAKQITATVGDATVTVAVTGSDQWFDSFMAGLAFDSAYSGSALAGVLGKTDFVGKYTLDSVAKLKALAELPIIAETGNPEDNKSLHGELDKLAAWEARSPEFTEWDLGKLGNVDPRLKKWAAAAVKYGNAAGVDPRLIMSIILNEGATRTLQGLGEPYDDFRWITSVFRDNSLGLTNMKEDTFKTVKQAYPNEFRDKGWSDLDGNEDLAVKATAYNLRRIQDKFDGQVPPEMRANVTRNEFVTAVYNAGDDHARDYIQAGKLGPHVTPYVQRADGHYDQADRWMRGTGAYACN